MRPASEKDLESAVAQCQHLRLAHRLAVDVDVKQGVAAHGDAQGVPDVLVDELEGVLGQVGHPRLRGHSSGQRIDHPALQLLMPGRGAHHRAAHNREVVVQRLSPVLLGDQPVEPRGGVEVGSELILLDERAEVLDVRVDLAPDAELGERLDQ